MAIIHSIFSRGHHKEALCCAPCIIFDSLTHLEPPCCFRKSLLARKATAAADITTKPDWKLERAWKVLWRWGAIIFHNAGEDCWKKKKSPKLIRKTARIRLRTLTFWRIRTRHVPFVGSLTEWWNKSGMVKSEDRKWAYSIQRLK